MNRTNERRTVGLWNRWRVARWTAAGALLLTPAVMMQISDEWNWEIGSFLFAGTIIGGLLLLYELADRASDSRAYRAGAAVALGTAFLAVWFTIVRDDATALDYLLLVLAAAMGSFAAWFRPAGMARAMLGVAAMQALLGLALATAPSTTALPGEPVRVLLYNGFFAGLWLIAGASFAVAARATVGRPKQAQPAT